MKTSLKVIDQRIGRIGKLGAELNGYIHDTAVMIVTHAATVGAGDVSRVTTLLAAMPNSFRKTAMKTWLARYTPVVLEGGKKGEAYKARLSDTYKEIKDDAKKLAAWKLLEGAAEPFYAIADKEPEEKDYDLAALIKMIQGMGKRINDKIAKGHVAANDVEAAKALALKVEAFAA